jgi:small subunit ribosomal protein S19
MSRSTKKGPYINERLASRVAKLRQGDKTVLKTWDRASTITPEMVGFTFGVHNGKTHVPVYIIENMVGHRLGEFSPTSKFSRHGGKMQKDLEIKQAEAAKVATEAAKTPAPAAPKK